MTPLDESKPEFEIYKDSEEEQKYIDQAENILKITPPMSPNSDSLNKSQQPERAHKIPILNLKKSGLYLSKYKTKEDRKNLDKLDGLIKSVRKMETQRRIEVKRQESYRSHAVRKYSYR